VIDRRDRLPVLGALFRDDFDFFSVTSGSFDGRMRNARSTTMAYAFKVNTMGAPTSESAIIGFASAPGSFTPCRKERS
jgi:hypothetical protein